MDGECDMRGNRDEGRGRRQGTMVYSGPPSPGGDAMIKLRLEVLVLMADG